MKRLVSLVPSITASLCRLGLKQNIVGITSFCCDPSDLHRQAKIVGGTKDPKIDVIFSLKPDIVFVNSEENRQEDIEKLRQECLVNETYPKSPREIPDILRSWGDWLPEIRINLNQSANEIEYKLSKIKPSPEIKSFLYFIWKNPYMVAGSDCYISKFIEMFGFCNAVPDFGRYPELSVQQIKEINPDVIFLSSEPYPFRNRDWVQLKHECEIKAQPFKADGKLISWHGLHLIDALDDYIQNGMTSESHLFKSIQLLDRS